MAREDRSQIGSRTGIASDVEGIPGAPRDEGPYRSRVGLDRVATLDAEPESESDRDLEHAEDGAPETAAHPARGARTRTIFGTGARAAAETSLEVDPSVGAGELGADLGEPRPPSAEPTAHPAPPMGKATPGLGTSMHARRAGEHARAHTSIEATEQEDRATRSAVVRGSEAKPVRATRGGDAHEGARDRSAGGARVHPGGIGPGATGPAHTKRGSTPRSPRAPRT